MRINSLIIHRASYIKKKLILNKAKETDLNYVQLLQIYQCRVFGLCIYRSLGDDKKTLERIKASKVFKGEIVRR